MRVAFSGSYSFSDLQIFSLLLHGPSCGTLEWLLLLFKHKSLTFHLLTNFGLLIGLSLTKASLAGRVSGIVLPSATLGLSLRPADSKSSSSDRALLQPTL